MMQSELKYWAALVAAAIGALLSAGVLRHPIDTWAMGVCAVAGAIAAFNITPPSSKA